MLRKLKINRGFVNTRVAALFISGIVLLSSGCSRAKIEKEETKINYELLDEDGFYTVKKGDNAYYIAEICGIPFNELVKNNREIRNLDLINPGQKLKICDMTNKDEIKEEIVGFKDYNGSYNNLGKTTDFILFSINSDDKTTQVDDLLNKIKACNDQNVSVGLVVNCEPSEIGIFKGIDDAKIFIDNFSIKYPVYINVDNILEAKNINISSKISLIRIFMEQCEKNGMYVGIYGTDKNLCILHENMDLDYDACVVMDNKKIKYPGSYSTYVTEDGTVHSKYAIQEIIKENKLNDVSGLYNNEKVTITKNNSIEDIAIKYDISEASLLEFNGIGIEDITIGTTLDLPGKYSEYILNEPEIIEEPILGCDLSEFQDYADWDKLKENFSFCILKCAEGHRIDSMFEDYAYNCQKRSIPMGVYYIPDVDSNLDMSEFRKETIRQYEYVLELIKDKKITLSVYLDFEGKNTYLPLEYINILLEEWKNVIEKNGYKIGFYSGQCDLDLAKNAYHGNMDDFQLWIAGGNQYNEDVEFNNLKNPDDYLIDEYGKDTLFQLTSQGLNGGAGTEDGYLDIDKSYVDFRIEKKEKEEYIRKQNPYRNTTSNEMSIPAMIFIPGVGLLSVALIVKFIKKSKIKSK